MLEFNQFVNKNIHEDFYKLKVKNSNKIIIRNRHLRNVEVEFTKCGLFFKSVCPEFRILNNECLPLFKIMLSKNGNIFREDSLISKDFLDGKTHKGVYLNFINESGLSLTFRSLATFGGGVKSIDKDFLDEDGYISYIKETKWEVASKIDSYERCSGLLDILKTHKCNESIVDFYKSKNFKDLCLDDREKLVKAFIDFLCEVKSYADNAFFSRYVFKDFSIFGSSNDLFIYSINKLSSINMDPRFLDKLSKIFIPSLLEDNISTIKSLKNNSDCDSKEYQCIQKILQGMVFFISSESEFFNDLKSEYVKDLVSDLNAIYEKTHKSFNVIIKNIQKVNSLRDKLFLNNQSKLIVEYIAKTKNIEFFNLYTLKLRSIKKALENDANDASPDDCNYVSIHIAYLFIGGDFDLKLNNESLLERSDSDEFILSHIKYAKKSLFDLKSHKLESINFVESLLESISHLSDSQYDEVLLNILMDASNVEVDKVLLMILKSAKSEIVWNYVYDRRLKLL